MKQFTLMLAAAAAVGWLFDLLHVPVGWLLGPMLVGVMAAGLNGGPRPLDQRYQTFGQVVLGLAIGVGFPLQTLLTAATHAVPLLVAVVITGGLSLLNGYLLWRWAGIDRATGFLGSLPGAAHSMVAMSDDMGADAVTVAVLQYWRLLLVIFLSPVAVRFLFPPGAGVEVATAAVAGPASASVWVNVPVLLACSALGLWGGTKAGLPSPTFLGPVLAALVASWTLPWAFHVPAPLFNAALLLVGLSIGARFDVAMARKLGRAALIETVLVLALIGISLLVGYGFHLVTGIDAMTAVLGSTPGGMDVMVASAAQLGGNAGLVLAMQMTRWFIVLM
ncbi:MAG TPA: AbrB family transcriptional regulator, partial [Symbiobacteriaceae bacterium]|nr:AbrB family transcriptional regulator [Symbiobacteriaceae bacterium]